MDVGQGDLLVFLFLGAEINATFVAEVHLSVIDLAVRGLDESERVDACIYAERRDKTDVRAFRSLDRAETAIVGVVYVTYSETGAVAAQTAGTEGAQTALVSHFGQRVDLVHELAQLAGAEEAVDYTAESLGVDQVDRGEDLVVADVHPFTDGACDTAQTYAELVGQLLAYSADTTVAEVVDIVD